MSIAESFTEVADFIARASGRPAAFAMAAASTALWLLAGPVLGFSDTWQLIANTSTSVITFLMVFVIQNSQNRDTAAHSLPCPGRACFRLSLCHGCSDEPFAPFTSWTRVMRGAPGRRGAASHDLTHPRRGYEGMLRRDRGYFVSNAARFAFNPR